MQLIKRKHIYFLIKMRKIVDLLKNVSYSVFSRITSNKKRGGKMNVNKLRGKIVENGFDIRSLSKKMGLDRSTFYRKLNNNGDTFTVKEINQMVSLLNLSANDAISIFFKQLVA